MAGIQSYLETPLYVPLRSGKDQEFRIRVRNAQQVQLRVGEKKWIPMRRAASDPDLYQLIASVPADARLQIVALPPQGGNTYWTIVDYAPDRK